ncbi:MAG: thermonuclease family protein [Candidatus Zixiibacteriota bacterium]
MNKRNTERKPSVQNRSGGRLSRRKMRIWRWLATLVLVAVILTVRLVERIGDDAVPDDRFVVVKVLDGDTVELRGGDEVRLLSIDTPEKGRAFYDRATAFTSRLCLGKAARIEYARRRRDKYGRLLGYLYVDDLFVNSELVDSGYANLYLFRDTDISREETRVLLEAQRRAIRSGAGIWSVEHPSESEYINLAGSYRFHRPGCRSIENRRSGQYRSFDSRTEAALTGLSPCRRCQP